MTLHSTPTATDDTELPSREDAVRARLALEVAVDQLVQPGQAHLHRDDGHEEIGEVLSLLEQVAEAVMPGMENTGGHSSGSRPPASLNALTLIAEIGTEMRLTCHGHQHPFAERLVDQVRQWGHHAEFWQHANPAYLVWAADRATRWVAQARVMLDPPPRYSLRGRACPICRTDTVLVWSDDEADYIRRPALSIDAERAQAICAECGHLWPLEIWAQLATALDQQLTHDTLATDSSR